MSSDDVNGPGIGRTKIVATIGPASSTPEVLRHLIEAGVSVFRLNFSHGTHEGHSAVVSHIRTVSREVGRQVGILQDLCGPKMRLGSLPADVIDCRLGDEYALVSQPSRQGTQELTCSYQRLPDDLKPGESVLLADGTVTMIVVDTAPGRARLKVTLAGRLRSRQGLNLPGSDLAVESLTDKDLQDLDWTARHAADVDFVGLSFVRTALDVARLRQELQARSCRARIVVKIEKPQAVQNLDAIVAATDAVMVARGDLAWRWTCSVCRPSRSASSRCATPPTVP
jgi:pyruvate kinase